MKNETKDISWTTTILIMVAVFATSYVLFGDHVAERPPGGGVYINGGTEICTDMTSVLQDHCELNEAYIEAGEPGSLISR